MACGCSKKTTSVATPEEILEAARIRAAARRDAASAIAASQAAAISNAKS